MQSFNFSFAYVWMVGVDAFFCVVLVFFFVEVVYGDRRLFLRWVADGHYLFVEISGF